MKEWRFGSSEKGVLEEGELEDPLGGVPGENRRQL